MRKSYVTVKHLLRDEFSDIFTDKKQKKKEKVKLIPHQLSFLRLVNFIKLKMVLIHFHLNYSHLTSYSPGVISFLWLY